METLKILLPLIGVLIGAGIQFLFSRQTKKYDNLNTQKTTAYIDFVKAMAGASNAQRRNDKNLEENYLRDLLEAKIKIILYGSDDVIQKLNNFQHLGASFFTEEQKKSFIELIKAMKKDCSAVKELGTKIDRYIEIILL